MPLCYAMPTDQCILNEIKVLGADLKAVTQHPTVCNRRPQTAY